MSPPFNLTTSITEKFLNPIKILETPIKVNNDRKKEQRKLHIIKALSS